MNPNYLDFEQPIAELEAKIEELQLIGNENDKLNITDELHRLRLKSTKLTEKIYADLSAWQVVQVARHPRRPYTLDYIRSLFTDFDELHGDRHFGDDTAIVGGLARLSGRPVMVIGQEKGRTVAQKVARNFGMPKPEGYRKALRLMQMAERFRVPLKRRCSMKWQTPLVRSSLNYSWKEVAVYVTSDHWRNHSTCWVASTTRISQS